MIIKRTKINYVETDPQIFASLLEDGADSVLQTYSETTGEYFPNRALIPLTLTPLIGYRLPSGEQSSNAHLKMSDIKWYRLTGNKKIGDAGTEIVHTAGVFEINTDTTSEKYGEIKIYENVPPGTQVTYVFQGWLSTPSRKLITLSCGARTIKTELMPRLFFDNAHITTYNPLGDIPEIKVRPYLSPEPDPAKATVAYVWKARHATSESKLSSEWSVVGTTPLDFALSVDPTTGELTIDRDSMPDDIRLICEATITIGTKQTVLSRAYAHKRRLPRIDWDTVGLMNISKDILRIQPEAVATIAKTVVPDDKLFKEIDQRWYRCGSTDVHIASGQKPILAVADITSNGIMNVGFEPRDRGGWKVFTDGAGRAILNGAGKPILVR
ncbi:MAG: hypothetical protein HDR49_00130 [Bacteroides sp.]|nr:hypothetical protein [Bacteroides sp.]